MRSPVRTDTLRQLQERHAVATGVCKAQEGVVWVGSQLHVVLRLEALDQCTLKDECLNLRFGDVPFNRRRTPRHRDDLAFAVGGEVRRQAGAQRHRLADVEDVTIRIPEEVAPRERWSCPHPVARRLRPPTGADLHGEVGPETRDARLAIGRNFHVPSNDSDTTAEAHEMRRLPSGRNDPLGFRSRAYSSLEHKRSVSSTSTQRTVGEGNRQPVSSVCFAQSSRRWMSGGRAWGS
jgi:hypothetical protein